MILFIKIIIVSEFIIKCTHVVLSVKIIYIFETIIEVKIVVLFITFIMVSETMIKAKIAVLFIKPPVSKIIITFTFAVLFKKSYWPRKI